MKRVRDYLESALGLQMCTKAVIHCLGIFWALSLTCVCDSDAVPTVTLRPSGPVYVDDGGSFSVTCEIDKFMSSNFLYFYKNDAIWTFIYDRISCGHTDITSGAVMCNGSNSFTMVLNLVSIVDHHSKWTCVINDEGCNTQSLPASCRSASATLLIIVPVTTVNLTNNSSQTLTSGIDIVRNANIGITCNTAPHGSRPRATFQWYKRQGSQSPMILNQSLSSTIDPIPVPGQPASDLIISYSTLILTGDMSYQNIYIFCQTRDETNTGIFVQSEEVQLNIVYSPAVNPFTSPVKVIQGKTMEIVCSAGGNPSPQLIWNPAGEDNMNRSRLYYAAISRDKAVNHTCTATNTMVPTTGSQQSGSDSRQLLIDVLYSPIVKPFTFPNEVIEGRSFMVVCSADSNPSPQLIWNPAGEDNMNRFRLYYATISRDKAVVHTCTATNNMVPTTGSQQSGSDSKQLVIDILYNASISKFNSKSKSSVLAEGNLLEIECQVDSNPYAVISLYLENSLKLELDKALNLNYNKSATCLDAGKYTCNATNRIMNGIAVSRELQVTVTCHPRLDYRRHFSTVRYGALGDNVTLEVYVIAYPKPENITWYHRQGEADIWQMFPYQFPSSSGFYSSLMVHLASESDFGYYMVNMSNSFGSYNETYQINAETVEDTPKTLGIPLAGIAGGVSASIVLILVMGLGIFLWRRSQYKKQNEHENDVMKEHKERSVRHDTANGQVYEGLHLNRGEASPYLQLNDIRLEENRNANTRFPENDSYEKLHPYTNNDIQMYSSLKIQKISKDSERMYENTQIM